MLLQLPKEVFFNILDFLVFQDKLNLAKTCRHLRNTTSERHLYEELPTFKSERKLRAALDAFKKYPFYGSQVKRISIENHFYTVEISVELPSVFPAIKEFRTVGTLEREEKPKIETLLPWKNTLEVVDGGSKLCIGYLLKDHLFAHLSSLTMFIPWSYHDTKYMSNTAFQKNFHLFDGFKNTPSLRHLELLGYYLHVEHLEELHKACPQLTSLCLSSLNLYASDIDTMPLSIEPAIQLLSLRVEKSLRVRNLRNAVLKYFIAKYTRLTEFAFLGGFTDDEFNSGESPKIYSDELVRQRRWFISSLPSTIKILQLNTDGFDDPLEALHESELDPTKLAFYQFGGINVVPSPVIKRPSQLRYLQSLRSLRSLTLEWDPGMEINNIILDGILHLKVQVLCGLLDNDVYHLADIISAYPSLKSLSVDHKGILNEVISLTGINHQSKKMVHASLRKLSIETHHFNPKAIEDISTLFPNLKELELTFFFESRGIIPDIVINLDGCEFYRLSLKLNSSRFVIVHILIYLHIKSFDKLKIYRVKFTDYQGIEFIRETNEGEDAVTRNKIRIICDSMKVFNFNGMDIKPF